MKLVTLAISALLICSSRAQENKEKEYVENELFPKPIIELTDETLTEMHESSWSQKNIEKRQTDIPFSYLTLSQQVFNAHVRARIYPLSFSKELAAFGDLKASYLAGNATVNITKCGPLVDSPSLRKAGQVLVLEQNKTSLIGHTGVNGSTPWSRMDQFGKWQLISGENIAYGPSTSLGVMSILIKSPEHYANIYRSSFKLLGVYCGPHPVYKTNCVMDFSGGFVPY